jgi:hypothetical protein
VLTPRRKGAKKGLFFSGEEMVVSLGVFASWREAAARAVVRFSPNPLSASPREPAIVAVVRFSPNPLSAFSAVKAVTVFPCGPRAKDYDVGMPRITAGKAKTREPGLETRQMIRRLFRSRLFIAALSAVISPVVLWALSRFCPPTPQTNSIVPSVTEQTFHLKTLRKGFPPFAYKVEFLGHRPEERSGFLNMQRIPPRWLYVVSVANLTAMDQPMVDISFCFKGQAKFVGIAPKAGKLFIALTSVLPQDDWTVLPNPNQPQPLHLAPLESGKGKCFIIGIFSDETPCTEDIVLSVSCPEGKFEKITPAQWASIGWETK